MEQAFEGLSAIAARVPLPDARSTTLHFLTKLTELDDIDAYLHTFKVVVSPETWDKRERARLLATFLTVEAQQAYFSP